MYQLATTVGLILMKLRRFHFSGYRQTRFQNPHMETCLHTKKFQFKNLELRVSSRSLTSLILKISYFSKQMIVCIHIYSSS